MTDGAAGELDARISADVLTLVRGTREAVRFELDEHHAGTLSEAIGRYRLVTR